MHQNLFARTKRPQTVRAGVIGCGQFGSTMVAHGHCVPRLEIPIVADLSVDAGRLAYLRAGIAEDAIAVCDNRAAALCAMEAGKSVVVQDGMILMDLPLDVIATSTRSPEAGALFAYEAIRHGKHVVMVDKEADTVVGPMLKHLADRAGVVYTTDDGDQPGLAIGLVGWAQSLGLEVLCAGNIWSCPYDPAAGTVRSKGVTVRVPEEDRWALARIPSGQAQRYAEARRRLFADFRAVEETGNALAHMAVVANNTGLLPDVPEGHRPVARFCELAEILCPVEEGGILHRRGVVDIPAILWTDDEPHGGRGVFAVVTCDNEHSRSTMIKLSLHANSRKTAMLLYRPYHLCGSEAGMSILCAGLLGVPTGGSTVLPRVDLVARAARAFSAGEVIGSTGTTGQSRDLVAAMIPAKSSETGPLPFFMLETNRLARDVTAGTVLTREMIVPPKGSVLWSLRKQQDDLFCADSEAVG